MYTGIQEKKFLIDHLCSAHSIKLIPCKSCDKSLFFGLWIGLPYSIQSIIVREKQIRTNHCIKRNSNVKNYCNIFYRSQVQFESTIMLNKRKVEY